jgi:hypothetical protein
MLSSRRRVLSMRQVWLSASSSFLMMMTGMYDDDE